MNTGKAVQGIFIVLASVVLAAGTASWAQTGTSRATGQVLDPTGAVVAGASVTLTNEATGIDYKTTTTDAGTYLFDALPPGTYTVRVEFSGFKTFVSKNNVLTVGLPLTVNVKLDLGDVTSTVEVTATYERVQTTTSGNLGAIVDNRTLTDLPLGLDLSTGGRNPLVFVRLQPGVNVGSNTGGGTHVNGARDRAFNYTLDGIDTNESSAGGSDFSPLRTNPDSIAEFRTITSNATAQYGRNSGAQVELATRSGSNDIHGTVFYFHRNNALSATEWEDNLNRIARPKLIQHQWGFSLGGPFIKKRTFYFMNYQEQRQVRPFTRTRTVYTSLARQGIFRYVVGGRNTPAGQPGASVDAQGNPLLPPCGPATTNCIATYNIVANDPRGLGLDPTIRDKWIGLTRLPNLFTTGDGLNTAGFIFSGGRLDPQRDFVLRFDHKFNDNNNVYVRYAWGRQDTINDTTNAGEPRFPGLPPIVNTERTPRNIAIGYRRVITPKMLNEFVVGANHFTFDFVIPDAGKTLPFQLNNVTDPLSNDRGNLRTINTYQVVDNFSINWGAHAIRAGINWRFQQHRDVRGSIAGLDSELEVTFNQTVINTACLTGTFGSGGTPGVGPTGTEFFCLPGSSGPLVINSIDQTRLRNSINDLLGRIGRLQQGFVAADDLQSYFPAGTTFGNDARYNEYDYYIQDTWRLRPNLTVDLGLRLELKSHPTSPLPRLFVPNQSVRFGAAASNTLQWVPGDLYKNDYNNFSPSVGFAWDPFKTGKTSLRANYRIAYDRINTFVVSSQIFNSVPGLTLGVINIGFGQNGGPGGTGGRWRDNVPAVAPPAGLTPLAQTKPAAFGVGGIAVIDPSFRAPKTHMWHLDLQREIGKGIVVDLAYIGRHAVSLFGAYDVNQVDIFNNGFLDAFKAVQAGGSSPLLNQLYGPDSRRLPGEPVSVFLRRQFRSFFDHGSVASLAADAASRVQSGVPLLQLAGLSPFFFRPYPQFESMVVIDSNDFSNYHGVQLMVSRKFTRNLTFQGSYTFSKSLDNRSFDPTFSVVRTGTVQSASSTPFDIRNRRLNYARSDFDRTHIVIAYGIWDLPLGRGQRFGANAPAILRHFIEGWQVNGVVTLESGRPFTVYSGFFQLSNLVSTPANCNGCPRDMGSVNLRDPNFGGVPSYFSPAEIARFSEPAPGTIGNTGRNYFTGPGFFNLDAALLKRTYVNENINVELRVETFNLTNSPSFGFPTARIDFTSFGRIRDNVESISRKVRLGLKINF